MTDDPNSISSNDPCWDAYWAISCGDPGPLIELLELQQGYMAPLLQRSLAAMLKETHKTFKLKISRVKRGTPNRRKPASGHRDRDIANYVSRLRAEPNPLGKKVLKKDAIFAAATDYKMNEREIRKAIARHERINAMIEHHMKADKNGV